MKKLFVFILLVLIAIVLTGLYGMVHNQISAILFRPNIYKICSISLA